MSVFETVTAERAKIGPVFDWVTLADGTRQRVDYTPYPTPEQLGVLLNAVAWAHRAEGWGLSAKPSGNSVPAPDGTRIAADILHNRNDNVIVDCLIAAGERSEPTWNVIGPMTDPSRPWVAPTAPEGTPVDPPVDPPDPPPSQPCVFQPCTHTEVLDVLADLHERLVALEAKIEALSAHDPPWVLRGTIDLWGAKRPVVGTVGGQS